MTIKEAAAAWGVTERRVNALCKAGRISGAYKEGRQWFIPDSTQKPMDKRGHRSVVKPAVSSARKPLPIGVSDYRDACKNYYYVDKTLMIKEFLDERPKVSLFTRPRRFGKTLNMDMLRTFFEKTTEDTSVYFRDKKIWSCGESYLAHHRKYPVIFLSFKDVKYTSWEETYQTLQKLIAQEFRRHDELSSSSALSDYEKEEYSLLATEAADEVEYQMSLRTLTLLLHKHHDVAPIVIIDEYDTPIQQGHVSGFYDTIIGFMRNLFSGGLKDNPHLSYGFLTGILRVAKESIFSGLNNLKINSILDERYSEYFGFTSSEVHEMADYYHASDKYQELCDWYDGYLFGNTEIFNPWSVIGYFNNNCRPKAFWQSTGSNDIIREVLASATPDIMERLELLMKGESFVTHIDTGVIYPTHSEARVREAKQTLVRLIKKYGVTLIAIGNGTASKETEIFTDETLRENHLDIDYMVVSEAGASVYSASKLAAAEYPEYDLTLRSAVSIAHRLQDPLAELVKIDPKAIGVGQYQHDMPAKRLDEALGGVVEACVNAVGVDLNTASPSLLENIAGISSAVAKNIVAYRQENGAFTTRTQIKKVPKLGPKAFEQCAGFLRVPESKNILDHTGVHPESYDAAGTLLTACGYDLKKAPEGGFKGLKEKAEKLGIAKLAVQCGVGEPTLKDIIAELEKPGRDPRDELPSPILRSDIKDMKDLKPGMVLSGTVRNVIDFGAFVDIGVHQDGLVHVSQMTDRYIKHPLEAVSVGDIVEVKVLAVDVAKKRISLTMKIRETK